MVNWWLILMVPEMVTSRVKQAICYTKLPIKPQNLIRGAMQLWVNNTKFQKFWFVVIKVQNADYRDKSYPNKLVPRSYGFACLECFEPESSRYTFEIMTLSSPTKFIKMTTPNVAFSLACRLAITLTCSHSWIFLFLLAFWLTNHTGIIM